MSSNTTVSHHRQIPLDAQYGYIPTFWICCTFVALFGLTTIVHILEALFFKPRLYWLIPTTAMCGIGEILGWSGRLWSSKNPLNGTAFLIQICTTIIAPVFLTAALYTILGLIIGILGSQYSRLKPKTYLRVFVTADVFALVVQAVGGGMASVANTLVASNRGAHVMLAGIFLQMAGMLFYTLLAIEFLFRFYLQKPLTAILSQSSAHSSRDSEIGTEKAWIPGNDRVVDGRGVMPPRIGLMVIGLTLSTIFVFIRTIYRTVELLGGWDGHILRTQIYFNVFDATPIVLALLVLNFLPPGLLLRNSETALKG